MSQIVICPGGFHPFHAGHYSLYNGAKEQFPEADVYVAATDDTSKRPFPFAIKEKLARVAGVDKGYFVKVKSPFRANEITDNYDPEKDTLIFVRSEKDRNEQPKPGGIKKDGSPSYFQPYTGKNIQPFNKHAYIAYLPTVKFGPDITSATEIRNSWPNLNDRQKLSMVMSLYPATQKNTKLANNVKQLLDAGMGSEEVTESAALSHSAVRKLQGFLNKKFRANLDVDGVLGNLTKQSIEKYMPSVSKQLAPNPNRTTRIQGFDNKKSQDQDMAEGKKKCPPATQNITLNLKNRQKAIDEYGYGPLNPDMPNHKFWMKKVDEWNLDSVEEAQQSLCGNCAAFDQRKDTLDCIAQGIGSDQGAEDPTIEAGELGYCRFLKF